MRLLRGTDVPKNAEEGIEYLKKAAEQDHTRAQSLLAQCYARGEGVRRDRNEAIRWARMAAEKNDAEALEVLRRFRVRL